MSEARYPPSPPASTSLPEHWQFVPPPTDGPNTRDRRARGLQPYSGTAAPLPVALAAGGPPVGEIGGLGLARVDEWNVWGGGASEQQYWYAAAPSTGSAATYYAIDPNLSFDPPPPILIPVASSSTLHQATDYPQPNLLDDRRLFSSATVIDHGSPPASPSLPPALPDPPSTAAPVAGLTSIGISKDEWLRLGGFVPEQPDDALPDPPPLPPSEQHATVLDDVFLAPPFRASNPAHSLDASALPPPTAYALPPPPPSGPPAATYALPPVYASYDRVSCEGSENLALPTPPPPLQPPDLSVFAAAKTEDADAELESSRTPARSQRRRAPSPLDHTRLRPAPYPTSQPRVLTPVSTALALYANHPVPSAPPPSASAGAAPGAPPKKKHARRFSVNHVPRPRNAFILFRSHAVSTGLIPRSMGITDHKNISQIVGSVWRGLSPDERRKWEELAEEEKRLHKERYPDYVFRPKQKGQRAPMGQGKKAKAKAAKLAAERERDDALAGIAVRSEDSHGDEVVDGDEAGADDDREGGVDDVDGEPRRSRRKGAGSLEERAPLHACDGDAREQRRMELIGQAVLEGEDDNAILARVDAELAAEERALRASVGASDVKVSGSPAAASPSRTSRRSSPAKAGAGQAVTPRKTRSSIHQRLKQESPASPSVHASPSATSSSTISPSPYRSARPPASPASSVSPSPKRMQAPGSTRSSASAPVGARHPLSRSVTQQVEHHADHDLPASRRMHKARSYAAAGLGVASSSSSHSGPATVPAVVAAAASPEYAFPHASALNTPLFAGPADSRQFSLGRWELRKPSTAAASQREALAAQEEADLRLGGTSGWLDRATSGGAGVSGGGGGGGGGATLALDPRAFLADAGLDNAAVDALSEYGTAASSSLWDDGASSAYETAASTAPPPSRMGDGIGVGGPARLPLFRAASSACGTVAEEGGPVFHFGDEDLFAQPPSAFATVHRTVSSVFGPPAGMASVVDAGDLGGVGLGIGLDGAGC
ncbi:hypothetical protein JCM3770_006803 [Rhodotorula araucariae]